MTDDGLAGQVAMVTGASRGIGAAIASHLAARGAAVVLVARSTSDLDAMAASIQAAGGTAHPAPADVTDAQAMHAAVQESRARLGPVDLAVHCAGTANVVGPIWESDIDAWWAEVAVHTRGAATVAHAVLPDMIARGQGRIVNVYGNLGDRGGSYASAYACGKAGLLRFTEHVNAEVAPHGVHLFAIHPGLVDTPMTRQLGASEAGRQWLPRFADIPDDRWHPPDNAARLVDAIARGRLDAFAGRMIAAWEDIDHLDAPSDPDERTLRTIPGGPQQSGSRHDRSAG